MLGELIKLWSAFGLMQAQALMLKSTGMGRKERIKSVQKGNLHTTGKAVPSSRAGEVLLEALGCGRLAKPWSSSLCEGKMGKEQPLFSLLGVTVALTGDFAIEQVLLPASLTCTLMSGLCLMGQPQ